VKRGIGQWTLGLATSALMVLVSAPVNAQVNVEPLRLQVKQGGFGARIGMSTTASGGNTDRLLLGGGVLVGGDEGPHFAYTTLTGDYGRARETTTVAKAFGHLRYAYEIARWLWGEAFGQLEADRLRRLLRRELLGAGPRVGYENDQVGLFYGTAYMLEWTLLDRRETVDSGEFRLRHRWNHYVTVSVSSVDRVLLVATGYYQPRFDDLGDYYLLFNPAVIFEVTGVLNARIEAQIRYESSPPEEVLPIDYTLKNVLEVAF
jgi:hypothetical protein